MKKGLLVCLGIFVVLAVIFGAVNNSNLPSSNAGVTSETAKNNQLELENEDLPRETLQQNADEKDNITQSIEHKKEQNLTSAEGQQIANNQGTAATDKLDTARLVVSSDYGRKILFNKQVPIKDGQTILGLLEENVAVEKAYGGSFVNSILGLSSGYGQNDERMDWFYWVNGVMGNVGGAQYKVKNGDKIWWDYHRWSNSAFIPNVVGSFPEPFLHGYKGKSTQTVIICSEQALGLAEKLNSSLQQKGINSVLEPNLETIPENKIVIALGTWRELQTNSLIAGYNKNAKKVGLFAAFEEDEFQALNDKSVKVKSFSNAGVIVSLGSGLGDYHPLWLITATDEKTLAFTTDLMINKTNLLENKIGLITNGTKVLSLPMEG